MYVDISYLFMYIGKRMYAISYYILYVHVPNTYTYTYTYTRAIRT